MAKITCPSVDACIVMTCDRTVISDFWNEGLSIMLGQEGYNKLLMAWNRQRIKIQDNGTETIDEIEIDDIIEFLGENGIYLTDYMGQFE